ncbi:MAG: aminotransferase class V-fold PLP-dependent enzyme [Gemmatimonadetes bacterium]|nr:aminotransferase class V-fold PLP-dependent enzyme [Gemmatimonadota bacterium]
MNLDKIRGETPGCEQRIHLNSAGASLMPKTVIEAVESHFNLEASIGGYEAESEAADEIAMAYEHVSKLLGTTTFNIAFSEHATASFVAAISSVRFAPGSVLLTTLNDYVSNQIQYLALAQRFGVEVVRAPEALEGGVDLKPMEAQIHRLPPKLVAVTHIPTNSGLVQNVEAIGAMCRAEDILYLVDGCQSIGQMPVDVETIGCDYFSATARKYLRGPRGAGFLYVSDRVLASGYEPLFPDLRGADWIAPDVYQPAPDAKRFETWEFAWGLVRGTGEAARYALELGLEPIRDRAWKLAAHLRKLLSDHDRVKVLDRGAVLGATVTASVDGWAPANLVRELRARGINTTGQARIDAIIDYAEKGIDGSLRISPHYFNTEEELSTFVNALDEIIN